MGKKIKPRFAGNRLKEFRKDRGLSQVKIARLLRTSQSTYSKWEMGLLGPNLLGIIALVKLHQCDITDLYPFLK